MRLALFDLDNTLVDRVGVFRRSIEWLGRDLGMESTEFVPFVERVDQDGAAGWPAWMNAAQEHFGFLGELPALVEQHRDRYLASFEVEQQVVASLAELRSDGWHTVIITNGSPTQLDVAERTGVLAVVDACLVSSMIELRKPDPAIFSLAAERVGADLERDTAWMVGDSPSLDIGGAQGVGINSIWISRGRTWEESRWAPTVTVDGIASAFDRLRET